MTQYVTYSRLQIANHLTDFKQLFIMTMAVTDWCNQNLSTKMLHTLHVFVIVGNQTDDQYIFF